MKLLLDATIDKNRRLCIAVSHKGVAANWYNYVLQLAELRQAFPPEHEWEIALEDNQIFINLPQCIKTVELPDYDVELTILDDQQAKMWEKLMLLWNPMSKDRSFTLNRSLTLEGLEKQMGSFPGKKKNGVRIRLHPAWEPTSSKIKAEKAIPFLRRRGGGVGAFVAKILNAAQKLMQATIN
ncbi:hypothetical protein PFICI_06397 [Pestalotiopsis fici W106-1]|uniref:Uncharacterized protein n=1 Tax=Pestalotiopsis fici (strain W106-1 / CGMCC3.15140) TaxID=1229662 RepID=W3X5R5_PESFW|nr:uncharacterized protein PFICI_06397 [Pestalotiopsis fici W106-1]ETS81395.1 hypothetical protein PFICI_06397 [Pestalotiopsis fici W106-1]